MRKICYITGTRADYGLMQSTLKQIDEAEELELHLIVTGMHLLEEYGNTWEEIERDGFRIAHKVSVSLSGASGLEMGVALGEQLTGMAKAIDSLQPDIIVILGDRGESLAAAIASLHLNIPIVHIHGGERSGTIDESMRHAISKVAHFHFTATQKSSERLVRMGVIKENVFVTGAPGLDAIVKLVPTDKEELCDSMELDSKKPFAVCLFHPVVQEKLESGAQAECVLQAILQSDMQCIVFLPNSDAGGFEIQQTIQRYAKEHGIFVKTHVPRQTFLSLVHHADVLVGNSSCGIIETATLSTPTVNVGTRQECRERNTNVIDVDCVTVDIVEAIQVARATKGQTWENVYGDGCASPKIVELLQTISLDLSILEQGNAY